MDLEKTTDRKQRTFVVVAVLEEGDFTEEQLKAGTVGYLLQGDDHTELMRSMEALRDGQRPGSKAVRRVTMQLHAGPKETKDHRLSPREKDVLRALVQGLSYKMIAAELRISFETVRSHMKCIYRKLQVNNNTAAVALALREGLYATGNAA